ncbi:ATP-dependent Clp protease adaptor ClpS, partial [Mesorhizobium sp. M1C.F.Ca.ET.193.01.1.1]|uniref:ATP-dependent Clp protease adaptor ClpS n=1 Tax=Mesorhizobium sp. M1C.F.Ca.ET.193.01.1.1 TaxID=2563926 RepID=UPI00247979D2
MVDLICSVFSRSEAEAEALTATVSQQGKAVCGSYPSAVAKAMLETAEQRIRAAGHPLCITVATGGGTDAVAPTGRPTQVSLRVTATSDGAAAAIGHPTQDSRDRK